MGNILKYQNPSSPLLIQRVNQSDANFVKRLLDPNIKHIQDWEDKSKIATHKMSWAEDEQGAFVYPEVQEIDGELVDFTHPSHKRSEGIDSAIERRDTVRMTPEQAEWFTTHYKDYYPKFQTFETYLELDDAIRYAEIGVKGNKARIKNATERVMRDINDYINNAASPMKKPSKVKTADNWRQPFDEMTPIEELGHRGKTTEDFILSDNYKKGGSIIKHKNGGIMIPDILKFFGGGGIPMFQDSGTIPRKVNVLTHRDPRMGDDHFVRPYVYGEHPGTDLQGIYHNNYVFNTDGQSTFEWDGDRNIRRHISSYEDASQPQDTNVFVSGVPISKNMFPKDSWQELHKYMDDKKTNALLGK